MEKEENQLVNYAPIIQPYFETDIDLWNKDWFPINWIFLDKLKDENVKLFFDSTFGFVILIINDEISGYGKNMALSHCKKYVGLGPAFGFEMGKIFIQGE